VIWSSNSTGCAKDSPFDLQCQTARDDQALEGPSRSLKGVYFRSVEYPFLGTTSGRSSGREMLS